MLLQLPIYFQQHNNQIQESVIKWLMSYSRSWRALRQFQIILYLQIRIFEFASYAMILSLMLSLVIDFAADFGIKYFINLITPRMVIIQSEYIALKQPSFFCQQSILACVQVLTNLQIDHCLWQPRKYNKSRVLRSILVVV